MRSCRNDSKSGNENRRKMGYGFLESETETVVSPPCRSKTAYPGFPGRGSGRRHYSPTLGRFISRDPIGKMGMVGLYTFIGNNTINYFDLWGLLGARETDREIMDCGGVVWETEWLLGATETQYKHAYIIQYVFENWFKMWDCQGNLIGENEVDPFYEKWDVEDYGSTITPRNIDKFIRTFGEESRECTKGIIVTKAMAVFWPLVAVLAGGAGGPEGFYRRGEHGHVPMSGLLDSVWESQANVDFLHEWAMLSSQVSKHLEQTWNCCNSSPWTSTDTVIINAAIR